MGDQYPRPRALGPALRGPWRAVGGKPHTQMVLERWVMRAEAGG